MPVCVEVCCLHSWFYILQFSSVQKESSSSTPGPPHDTQSVGTIGKFALHVHSWSVLKIWGRCIFKTIVYSKWLMLNFTSWHCPVRSLPGMNATTIVSFFMVLRGIMGDLRKISAIGFCVVRFRLFFRKNGNLWSCQCYIIWHCCSSGFEWVTLQKKKNLDKTIFGLELFGNFEYTLWSP